MKTLGDILNLYFPAAAHTESPINRPQQLVSELLGHRDNKFVLCKPEETPQGEGCFVQCQAPVGKYRADILITVKAYTRTPKIWPPLAEFKMAVECDGKDFHTSPEQKAHDKERDDYFKSQGIKTVRFTGSEIYRGVKMVVLEIINHIENGIKLP